MRFFVLLLMLGLFLLCPVRISLAEAPNIVAATDLTGGGDGDLDSINGAILSDGDAAIVVTDSFTYYYTLDADSGLAESSPDVIKPDTNAGDKRWILTKIYPGSVDDAYDTITINAAAFTPSLSFGPVETTMQMNSSNKLVDDFYIFNGTTTAYLVKSMVMPDSWDLGTLKAKFYWTYNSTETLDGNATEWAIRATALSDGESLTGVTWGTAVSMWDALESWNATHVTSSTSDFTVGNSPAKGDLVYFQVYRNTTSSFDNASAADVYLNAVLLQFKRTHTTSEW